MTPSQSPKNQSKGCSTLRVIVHWPIDSVTKLRPTSDGHQAVYSCAAMQTIPPISCVLRCNRQRTDHILCNCATLHNILIVSLVNPAHTDYILCYSAILPNILIISCTLLH